MKNKEQIIQELKRSAESLGKAVNLLERSKQETACNKIYEAMTKTFRNLDLAIAKVQDL